MSKMMIFDADCLLERLKAAKFEKISNEEILAVFEELGIVLSVVEANDLNREQMALVQELKAFVEPLEDSLFARGYIVPTSEKVLAMDDDLVWKHVEFMDLDSLFYTSDVWKDKARKNGEYFRLYSIANEEIVSRMEKVTANQGLS